MISENKNIPIIGKNSNVLSKPKTLLKRCLGFIAAVIIFSVMLWPLAGNLESFLVQTIELRPLLLISSVILLLIYFIITGLGWWILLHFFGGSLPPLQAVRISALAMLGKYIPGKIWTVAGKIYMAHAKGESGEITYISSIYEFILVNLSGIFVFLLLETISSTGIIYSRDLFLVFIVFVTLFIGYPNSITWFLNHTLRVIRRAPVKKSLTRFQLFSMFLYYSVAWLICGFSFCLFIWGGGGGIAYSQLTGALVLAYIVGFAVLFAPGGLGVREGVIASLLILAGVTNDLAVLVSLSSRIWSTVGELFIVILMYFFKEKESS